MIETHGWMLVSGEQHQARNPSFSLPDRQARESLRLGDAAKLLFDIETRVAGRVTDRGVDRMWVIVKRRVDHGYLGVLDNDPGKAEGLDLRPGTELLFTAEHVVDINHPPRDYVFEKYGADFLDE